MKPDYDRAAAKAAEIRSTTEGDVNPLEILEGMDVSVVSFSEMSKKTNVSRRTICALNKDAVTCVYMKDGKPHYMIAYNKRLAQNKVRFALAREMAHIVLGHDGSLPDWTRAEEAICFARNLLRE